MSESTHSESLDTMLPLRDRLGDYVATFAIGWLAVVVVGLGIGAFSTASLVEGIAYAAVAYGVVLLLSGGATGGGYTSLGIGAAGAVLGSRHRHDDDFEDPEVRRGRVKSSDPRDRLRKGLRPEKNPRAFWQVMAGFAYLAGGIALLEFLT
ncbi:MAG: hypothetical protein U9N84_08970 [Actinomycetota bacterium]|nr:hypothetical protein [Actinomycetota bacterium]